MQPTSTSPRFELSVNGKVLGTAGIDGYGVLTTILDWVQRDPAGRDEGVSEEELQVDLAGLCSDGHLDWAKRDLQVGDVVTIRVLPPGSFDSVEPRPAGEG